MIQPDIQLDTQLDTQPHTQTKPFPSSSITSILNRDDYNRVVEALDDLIGGPYRIMTDAELDEFERLGKLVFEFERKIYPDDLDELAIKEG